jgi:hypothetical protein
MAAQLVASRVVLSSTELVKGLEHESGFFIARPCIFIVSAERHQTE